MVRPMSSTGRWLALVASATLAVTAVAALVVVVAGRTPRTLPADSPEGAIQRYVAALDAGDSAGALSWFSSDIRADVDVDAYRRILDRARAAEPDDQSPRVLFDGTELSGDRAVVRLTVERLYGDGLDASLVRDQRSIPMIREGDGWRIDELLAWLDPAPIDHTD